MTWRVGIGQVDFTPEPGLPLMGHLRDDYGAKGVHDPLYARSLVFQGPDGAKLALVSLDLCMITRRQVAMMRDFISSQCDIPPESILVAVTHTHGGPATIGLYGAPQAPDDAIEAFLKKACLATVAADHDLADSELAVGYSREERVSFNRRLKGKDGRCYMNWEAVAPELVGGAFGPIDPQLSALFVSRAGRPAAVLVNFALHPAIVDFRNSLYTADYPGYLAEGVARSLGEDTVTIFFNGCCGNVNHADYRDRELGSCYKISQRVGFTLAVAVSEAYRNRVPLEGKSLAVSSERVRLKRFPISEEKKAWCEKFLAEKGTTETTGMDGLSEEQCAILCLDLYNRQHEDDDAEVMAGRIGQLGLVSLPGEVFCEFGLEIKQRSPASHTLVFELANDAIGYLPTPEAFDQGGYETMPGSTSYAPDAGQRLTTSAVAQLRALFGVR